VLILEDRLKKLKSGMLKGELSGFEFDQEMKKKVVDRFQPKRRTFQFRGLVPAGLSAAFLLIFAVGIYWVIDSSPTNLGEKPPGDETPVVQEPDTEEKPVVEEKPDVEVEPNVETLDEAKAAAILDQYQNTMKMVFEDASDQPGFKFKTYTKLEEIYALFSDFMSRDVAVAIFTGRIEEKADGLYNLPTEYPPNYWPDSPYTLEEVSETEYKFSQYQEFDDSFGKQLTVIFRYDAGKWKIDSLQRKEASPASSFTEDKAIGLLERYNNTRESVYMDVDWQNREKFRTYKTKEDFYSLFLLFMSREYVESNYSFRIEEKEDGLYVVPMDSPRTYWAGTPYEFVKVNDNEYQVIQQQESDLYGKETFTATFKHQDGTWKIDSIVPKD
jgi:hypothetical protein